MKDSEVHQQCLVAIRDENYVLALSIIEAELMLDNSNFFSLYLKGIILAGIGRYSDSIYFFSSAITLKPDFFNGFFNRGISFGAIGENERAIADLDTALSMRPKSVRILLAKGNFLARLGRFSEAEAVYKHALMQKRDYKNIESFDILVNLAVVLQRLGKHSESLENFSEALLYDPRHRRALLNRSNLLIELNQYQQAEDDLRAVITDHPRYAEAQNSMGYLYYKRRQLYLAAQHYELALSITPSFPEALANLGIVYRELGLFDKAMHCFNRAIDIRCDFWEAHWNKGLLHLLLGDFPIGWRLYETRKTLRLAATMAKQSKNSLFGPLSGKTVLIKSEQGYGDVIQFCRLLKIFDNSQIKCYFEVPEGLVDLVASLDSQISVVPTGSILPICDLEEDLLSLPLFFGLTRENIPRYAAYLFADKQLVLRWKKRIGSDIDSLKIGFVWSGNKSHDDDVKRSISLVLLSQVLELPVQCHSLQKEYRDGDRELFLQHARCFDHSNELVNFSETAALIECMDLVISVDTAIAHLAGALGKRVWILLPHVPDFRWMLDRNDSPWYPSAELFRQTQIDDWSGVITQVELKLLQMIHDCERPNSGSS